MIPEQDGIYERLNDVAYNSGNSAALDLSPLEKWSRRMQAPVVSEILFHFHGGGTVTGVTATGLGEDNYGLIRTLNMRDREGFLYENVSGKSLRIIEQIERGSRQVDRAVLASGATSTAFDVVIRVVLDIDEQGRRSKDYRIPLLHFTEGGEVVTTMGTNPGLDMPSANYAMTPYFKLVDERTREVKSRNTWVERDVTNISDNYDVNGSLRNLILTSDLGNVAGYTSLAALVSVNSAALLLPPSMDTQILRDRYLQNRIDPAADDEVLAAVPNAISIWQAERGQRIGTMPMLSKVDINNLAAVPSSGVVLINAIKDRSGMLASEWMGYGSVNDYAVAVQKLGHVKNVGSGKSHVKFWDPALVRRLPLELRS